MYLDKISFINYRNLVDNKITFSNKTNIFVGVNGQGKTNLLETIYFLSLTKSFKTNRLLDLVKFESEGFYIKSLIIKSNYKYLIEASYENDDKKIKVNNNSAKFKDIIGLMNAVLFIPEDLQLLKGSPKLRRRLLDIELSKIYSKYLYNLSSYYQILKQRNALLKSESIDDTILDTLDQQLTSFGDVIIEFRLKFIEELLPIINKVYQDISKRNQTITINYVSSVYLKGKSFYDSLKQSIKRDLVLQQTSIGIHRDDFDILLDGKDTSIYASQGEQRSIVLAIKLALVEYIYSKTNEYPILLLDDVLSELDELRQNNLLVYLNSNVQTFITTTSTNNISNSIKQQAKVFTINNGLIKEAYLNGK